jgi:hypothetical protein
MSQVERTHQIYLDLPFPANFQKLHLLSEFNALSVAQVRLLPIDAIYATVLGGLVFEDLIMFSMLSHGASPGRVPFR